MAFFLANLADLYVAERKYADAEPAYQRSIALFEQTAGPGSTVVAMFLGQYAHLLLELDRREEAAALISHVKVIYEKTRGGRPEVK